ncbi:MAG: hypothetical protein FJZ87_04290 [Chloroflexi bacterium]|nr:hypothetical protein [Chloroflexota bacterium]
MISLINKSLDELALACDRRSSVFDVRIVHLDGNQLTLAGRVLKAAQVEELHLRFPDLKLDTSSIGILDRSGLPHRFIATNLTGLYEEPTFGMPLTSELTFGTDLEVLEEKERWVFTRQRDGYLGWVYNQYLTSDTIPTETHLVLSPSVEIHTEPERSSEILSRLMSGTGLSIAQSQNGWAYIRAHVSGWIPMDALRPVSDHPKTLEARRRTLVGDSSRMIGVPYLWGGTSGNGIDCSGFMRLLHHWIGIDIPRDADMQAEAARPVKPPHQVGDLFFFGDGEGLRRITHVGMSLGGWRMIHSSRARNGVYVDDLEQNQTLMNKLLSAGSFLF